MILSYSFINIFSARVYTERVEKKLVEPLALTCIVSLFRQKPVFETVVVELDSMMQRSTLLVKVGGGVLIEYTRDLIAMSEIPLESCYRH